MANDGELKFGTKIDTKGFEDGVDDIKKKGKEATGSFDDGVDSNNKSLLNLKNTAKVVGTYVAGSLFKDALTQGVQFNAQIEQYTSTFETFTGSAEKANKVVNDLVKMGASTPFEFLDLANATQKLMSFGLSADDAIGSLTMLGDASQGDAQKLDSIVTAFGRMSSSAKVTLEDLNMMIDSGFNPLTQVAKNTGMSMAEVYDAISKGELPVSEVTKAMQQMTSEGGQYFGLMEKQSETFNGKMSTLSDTWNTFLGERVKPLNDFLSTTLIPTLIYVLSNFQQFQPIFNGIGIALGVVTGLYVLYNVQQALATANLTLWNAICLGATTITTALGSAFAFLTSPMVIAIGVIALVVVAITQLWNTNEGFRNAVITAWNGISQTLSTIYNNILKPVFDELVKVLIDVYNNGIKPLWNQFVAFANTVVQALTSMWNSIKPIVDWILKYFGWVMRDSLKNLVNYFGNMFKTITSTLSAWFNNVSQIVNGVKSIFNGIIKFITGVFTGNWKKAWNGVKDIFSGVFNALAGLVKAPINGVIGAFNTMIGGLNSLSFDVPDWIPGIGGKKFGLSIPKIPYLEKGGVLAKGQVGYLEGNGAEAVVPLDRNKYWVKAVAKEFARVMPQTITNNREQVINFYQKAESPDEISRRIRIDARLGLTG